MSQVIEEQFQFQAETKQLLELMIHSIYSNKEIFLRELISNASDALDKLRFESLTNDALKDVLEQAEIRLEVDKNNRTLTIKDTGIGMSKDELIENIGTIAKSGTREMVQKLQSEKKTNAEELIGQFGVGFYSAFMVADKVALITRRADQDQGWHWESKGDGEYKVKEVAKEDHGTEIVLYLKPEDSENGVDDYTDYWTIENVVKKYSDFIDYPVILREEKEEKEKDKDGKEIEGGKSKTVIEDRTLNSQKPIWLRKKSEVKDEEYNEFYKLISHDWTDPLERIAFNAEGTQEYSALLFIPKKAPFDLFYPTHEGGLRLYVKRVLIMEKCEDLVPKYLRFAKGIVDSSDLPLNISREILQKNRAILAIQKRVTSKILSTLKKIQEKEPEKYLEFWKEFGSAVKEGISMDFENKDKLMNLFMFESSADTSKLTTLKDYFSRMKSEQKEIYYLTGENRETVENSPHIEAFKAKGYEVLYLTDPVDELVVQSLTEFEGKQLKSIGKGEIELGDEKEKKEKEKELKEKKEEYKDLLSLLQKKLDENIKEVRISKRLVDSPVCLVGEEHEMSPHLEKLLANTGGGIDRPKTKRIMEINTDHSMIKKLQTTFEKNSEDNKLSEYAELLYGYALLAEGSELKNPKKFNKILAQVMTKAI